MSAYLFRMRTLFVLLLSFFALPLYAKFLSLGPTPITNAAPVLATFATDPIADCGPTDGTVTISGNTISIALFRATDAPVCPPDVRPRSVTVNLGVLAPGDYTITALYLDITWNHRFTVADAAYLRPEIWFDPPNPDSKTPVTAHVVNAFFNNCRATGASAGHGRHSIGIKINFDCSMQPTGGQFDQAVDLGILPADIYEVLVGANDLLILLASGSLVVQDAAPPLRISPNVINPGDRVTIRAPGLAPACGLAACPQAVVSFGDARATVVSTRDTDTVVVIAPPHLPGPVEVTIPLGAQILRSFVYYGVAAGAPLPEFTEPVLIPVAISGPGAFGSQWSTELTMRNDNDFPVTAGLFDDPCMPVCDSRVQSRTARLVRPNAPDGALFYVSREATPKLSFGALARDLSRQSETLGTQLPVVREKDFFNRPFTILNVPSDARYRVALRLYRIDGGSSVHLRVIPLEAIEGYGPAAEAQPLVDVEMPLTSHGLFASGFVGDLLTAYPQLAGKGGLRIEISHTSIQRATWAFVSVTNNKTQDITVITPQ